MVPRDADRGRWTRLHSIPQVILMRLATCHPDRKHWAKGLCYPLAWVLQVGPMGRDFLQFFGGIAGLAAGGAVGIVHYQSETGTT
jgi:hypothetical protein